MACHNKVYFPYIILTQTIIYFTDTPSLNNPTAFNCLCRFFVIEGAFIYLCEGAQQIISSTTAAAKIAASASSASYSSLMPSVVVTLVVQITRQKRGPVGDSRSTNSVISSG